MKPTLWPYDGSIIEVRNCFSSFFCEHFFFHSPRCEFYSQWYKLQKKKKWCTRHSSEKTKVRFYTSQHILFGRAIFFFCLFTRVETVSSIDSKTTKCTISIYSVAQTVTTLTYRFRFRRRE